VVAALCCEIKSIYGKLLTMTVQSSCTAPSPESISEKHPKVSSNLEDLAAPRHEQHLFTLRAKLSGTVYCYRSCV